MTLGTSSTGFTVWFTGMSGAGKSTLAQGLANRLKRLGKSLDVLDGAEVESMLGIGKAITKDERNAEVRKLAWVCKLVTRGGGMVVQAAVESPYREAREEARRQIGRFAEIFVECPIDTLISRDKSGKYKRALAGELKTLPGITEPYEPPLHPEAIVDTGKHSVDEAVEHILGQLVAHRLLDPALAAMKVRPRVQARATGGGKKEAAPRVDAPAVRKEASAPRKEPARPRLVKPPAAKPAPARKAKPAAKSARLAAPARKVSGAREKLAAGGKRKR